MQGCSVDAEEAIALNSPAQRGEVPDGPMGFMAHLIRMQRLVPMWIAAAVVLLVSITASAAQPKRILFLHSFGPNFQQGALWSREIQNEMNRQSPWPLDIQEHSLVTARNGDSA